MEVYSRVFQHFPLLLLRSVRRTAMLWRCWQMVLACWRSKDALWGHGKCGLVQRISYHAQNLSLFPTKNPPVEEQISPFSCRFCNAKRCILHSKTVRSAFQKWQFCILKVAVLHPKSGSFAMQKWQFWRMA